MRGAVVGLSPVRAAAIVIPAKAGIQGFLAAGSRAARGVVDSRVRGNDGAAATAVRTPDLEATR
jgi:hypothetical protein